MKVVMIGGVAAGMSAASKLRRLQPDAEIVVYEKNKVVSYGACGLPYYVSGLNPDPDKMLIRSAAQFEEQGIRVRTECCAVRVSPEDKTILLRSVVDGALFTDRYDQLLIATGAAAIRPPLPGVNSKGVHLLKSIADAAALKESLEGKTEVVVVGGGYIGVEVAESLLEQGKRIRLIEASANLLTSFDPEIREIIQSRMVQRGMEIHLEEALKEIEQDADGVVTGVRTAKGAYPAEVVVLALGVRPCTDFLADTGIQRMKNGAIVVDRSMRTSIEDIFAAGDCASVYDRAAKQNTWLALGTVANKCGRIAGENMAGGKACFDGVLGSAALSVCGLEAARTGLSEAAAQKLYPAVSTVLIQAHDRPPYYPNPTPLWIKLVCEKRTRRILGGQAVGEKGAVLRVDAIALAITGGLSAPELGMADLCYAPPFAQVWDALNIAGNAVK